jgi:methylated-DNA-[protein]-cysteine S-methyltransferase
MPLTRSVGHIPGLGQIAAVVSDRGLISIAYHAWSEQAPIRHRREPIEDGQHPVCEALWRHLEAYLFGRCRDFPIACDLHGLPQVHRAALEAVRNVPWGESRTYAAIAERIPNATPPLVRDALARNPVPSVIPCHRGIDGAHIGSYVGSIGTKRTLLGLEGFNHAGLPDPPMRDRRI